MRRALKTIVCVIAVVLCFVIGAGATACSPETFTDNGYICDEYKDNFSVGAAVLTGNINRYDKAGLMHHFNSITAENEMKWRFVEPEEGQYSFGAGDSLVSWAKEHNTEVRGHCLVWYKSLPPWLTQKELTKESALEILRKHITDVMTHFKGELYVWDVCNEALHGNISQAQLDSGDIWRRGSEASGDNSLDWYGLCGVDFIKEAFRTADQVRKSLGDDVKLFYNDYTLNNPLKRQAVVKLVEMLRADGIAIDGIGMQAHYRLPQYEADRDAFMADFEDSVRTFTDMGLDVHITELDIQVYPYNGSTQAFDGLPLEVEIAQGEMYADIFRVCRKYSAPTAAGHGRVSNVTTWGVADDHTYASTSIHTEYPLIFSRDLQPKRAYYEIISL